MKYGIHYSYLLALTDLIIEHIVKISFFELQSQGLVWMWASQHVAMTRPAVDTVMSILMILDARVMSLAISEATVVQMLQT